jgi:pyrroline-5-carboxylate reductase
MSTTAIFGAGVMGETLLSGLIRAGRDVGDLTITEKRTDHATRLNEKYGVSVLDNATAAESADVLVLVVKPQDMHGLLAEIRDHVVPGNLVVSLAAGITTEFLESRLPEGSSVVRVMPNTPALVDQGMAAISPGQHCTEEHLAEAEALLRSCGRVVQVPESYQDAVTAISGSGPAYIFYVVEAMIEAGVVLGLPRATSTELVVQTLFGAATMLKETGEHPTVLRERVSSPGGTTVAALRQLDDHKVRAAFIRAIEAAAQRSHELAAGKP